MFIFVDKLRNLLILKGFKTVWTDGSNIKSYVPHNEAELIAVEADEKIATLQAEINGLIRENVQLAKRVVLMEALQAEIDRLNKLVDEVTEKLMNYVVDEDEQE